MAPTIRQAFTCLTLLTTLATAYRPVQMVKHTGDNGRADQGFSLTQYYNTTTSQSDLYIRMEAYRYKSTAKGWTALALGPMMMGALMFITYGDPTSPDPMTVTVRTASGHHPPLVLSEMTDFYQGTIPEVDVISAHFEEYAGSYFSPAMQLSPSHIAVTELIVRGYDRWTGCGISNSTTHQEFIWSSNFKQDFEGDFTVDRHIDMHQFGLGFGFLWVDLENALVPEPMFGPLNDQEGHKGVNEIANPAEPTKEELEAGDAYIASHKSISDPASEPQATTSLPTSTAAPSATEATAAAESSPTQPTTTLNPNPDVEQPVKTPNGFSLRSIMWHLHGLLMVLAFLALYPLGTYLIHAPRPDAFNLHWTVQALGSCSVLISSIIAYLNSHSISIPHQYAGIVIVLAIVGQGVLGWRHHVKFLATKERTWMSRIHKYLGRVLLPLGFINILTGLSLRGYGWFTTFLVGAVMIVELAGLSYYLFMASRRNARMDQGVGGIGGVGAGGKEMMTGADAEEYFQLAGDDDDEFSDSDDGREGALGEDGKTKAERKREESERLRRLDKV